MLLRMAKTTKDPQVASGLIQPAADLKDRTGELPPVDIEAVAEESRKSNEELRLPQLAASFISELM
ncbi:hypothetical protein SAMN05216338_100577 [Bradyrhizobium sp. Rc2d]|nr:hypothetical protein SAMN05216338_100577 [Bradyrhizobium sp. Rc2d]